LAFYQHEAKSVTRTSEEKENISIKLCRIK